MLGSMMCWTETNANDPARKVFRTVEMTYNHHEASERTYRSIGRFIFEFSQAEFTIRHYLALEIDLDDSFFDAIVASYDVALLCTVAKEIFEKTRAESNAGAIKGLLNDFLELSTSRNRVAHGLWVPFRDGGTVIHVARSSLKSRPHDGQAEGLERLANAANKLRNQLEQEFSGFEM